MVRYRLGVEDLARTHFAVSPLQELVFSLWVLRDPGRHATHLPWRREVLGRLDEFDAGLLLALVGSKLALPDFLTPRPAGFAPAVSEQLEAVRMTPPELVRRDLRGTHAGVRLPAALRAATSPDDASVGALRDEICDALEDYWTLALAPAWAQMRLVLEGDMAHRARALTAGGARGLFADMHPNLRWHDGVLQIDEMLSEHEVDAAGRGLLLLPSIFAYKPVPPLSALEAPWLAYPSRGVGTLWAPYLPAPSEAHDVAALLGASRARLLALLAEPLPTVELARRLDVTPSAVSQHLRVLHATGLLTRTRDGRYVRYRRSALGEELLSGSGRTM